MDNEPTNVEKRFLHVSWHNVQKFRNYETIKAMAVQTLEKWDAVNHLRFANVYDSDHARIRISVQIGWLPYSSKHGGQWKLVHRVSQVQLEEKALKAWWEEK